MRLDRPLAEDLSPLANWLLILLLIAPVGACIVLLELTQTRSWYGALASGGLAIAGGVSAMFWERSRFLRCCPLLYGLAFGIALHIVGDERAPIGFVEATAAGLVVGLGMMFAVWVEIDSVRRADSN